MVSRLSHLSIDCHDAYALSTWWKRVLAYVDIDDDPNLPGHEECMIVDPSTGQQILFIEVPDEKPGKNRLHLDLRPTDRRRDDEVARLLAAGAIEVADRRRPDGTGWMVLADPEGNEFCVLRGDAELAESPAESP